MWGDRAGFPVRLDHLTLQQQGVGAPFIPHPCQRLTLPVCPSLAVLVGARRYLVVTISVFLMTNEVEELFLYMLPSL